MSVSRAKYTASGGVELRFPYHPILVEVLKGTIPAYARSWEPVAKVWTADAAWAGIAINLLRSYFPDVEIVPFAASKTPAPTPIRQRDRHLAALHLQPGAPAYVIEAVYKAIAREEHPDRKPTHERVRAHERMIEVNRAVESLRATG